MKKTITEKNLRSAILDMLENTALGTDSVGPIDVNPVVDPSASETDPINPSFSPQNKAEFEVATRNLVKNIPDDKVAGIYDTLKNVVDDQLAVAADDEQRRKAEKSGTSMQTKSGINVEEALRQAIRKMLKEAPAATKVVPPGDVNITDKDDMGPDGMEFQDMAKELGHGEKVHNVRREFERAVMKMRFLAGMESKERELLIGTAFEDFMADVDEGKEDLTQADFKWLSGEQRYVVDEYVELLKSAGDLTAGDVMLMRDHPSIVAEQPGFKAFLFDNHPDVARALPSFTEYLHDYVRSAMRGQQIEIPEGLQRVGTGKKL